MNLPTQAQASPAMARRKTAHAARMLAQDSLRPLLSTLATCLAIFLGFGFVNTAAAGCSYDLSPTSRNHGFGATTAKVSVVTSSSCTWTVTNTNDWITILSGTSGVDSGDITYTVAANPNTGTRQGVLRIQGASTDGLDFTVIQSGVLCTFSISPTSHDKCYGSTTGSVQITTQSPCTWTVINTNDWITIAGPGSDTGGAKIFYTVFENTSTAARTGVVLMADVPFTVKQAGIPFACSADKTVECGTAWDFDPPTQIGSAGVSLRLLSTVTNTICGNSFSATRTWQVTADCGTLSQCSQTVTSLSRPPLLICAWDRVVRCDMAWDFEPPQVIAACGYQLRVLSTVTNRLCGSSFTAIRTWEATDGCTNIGCSQRIDVIDQIPPVVVCPPDITVSNLATVPPRPQTLADFLSAGGQAADTCDNILGYRCLDGPLIGGPCSGTIQRTHTLTDSCSNSASCIQIITVTRTASTITAGNDSLAAVRDVPCIVPKATFLANDTGTDGGPLSIAAVSANSAKGGSVILSGANVVYTPPRGLVATDTFTYNVADPCGNTAMATVTVKVEPPNQAPLVASTTVHTRLNTAVALTLSNLVALATDSDGDPLTVTAADIVSIGNLTLTASNVIAFPPLNFVGSFQYTFTISDGRGGLGTGTVTVVVEDVPLAMIDEAPLFNPQTGLFEQRLTVSNEGGTTIAALQFCISGLRTNIRVWNATGTNAGIPYVQYNHPLDPGTTATLRIEYYVPDRHLFTPIITMKTVMPSVTTNVSSAGSVTIDRCFMDTRVAGEPRLVIELTSIPGRTYTIIYSDDAMNWAPATPSVTATSNRTQWYDDGPPKTESKPATKGTRFYKVLLAP